MIYSKERTENVKESIEEIEISDKERQDLEEEPVVEIIIEPSHEAKSTWNSVDVESSDFELLANIKEHMFEVNDVDSFDIQGLEKPALDIEYLDDFTVEVNEEIVALRALNRNVELCEAEQIDDIFIKGEPRQYNDE